MTIDNQHKKILRIKNGGNETIEGSEELRKSMNVMKDNPDALVDEAIRFAKEKNDSGT